MHAPSRKGHDGALLGEVMYIGIRGGWNGDSRMTRSESGGFKWKAEGWRQAPEGITAMVPEGVCWEIRVGGGRRNLDRGSLSGGSWEMGC